SCRTPQRVWMQSGPKREKAALCGCGILENVADPVLQRCRRTRRDPSSSIERRRKVARASVRSGIMGQGHTADALAMSSASEPRDAAVQVVLVRPLDLGGDD